MWASTWALNTLIGRGKRQDWMPHMIGKAITAHTGATHGMTLSAIAGVYYRFMLPYGLKRFARFARVVWEIPANGKTEEQLAAEGIAALESWIKEIGAVSNISELGVSAEMLPAIADSTVLNQGGFKKLDRSEVIAILSAGLNFVI